MKEHKMIRFFYIMAFLLTFTMFSSADARIKIVGNGEQLNFDLESIPPNFKASYDIMNQVCTNCHSMKKIVIAVQTGKGPDTKQTFDKQAVKAYCIKMLRKKGSVLMTKSDIKNVYQLLNYLLDENAR